MTVSYCFFVKTQKAANEVQETLSRFWLGAAYAVSVFKDGAYTVVFLERAFGLPEEQPMAEKVIDSLFSIATDQRILYSRCDDPYFIGEPEKKIKKADVFTKEYKPSYNVSTPYLYEIENV